MVISDYGVFDSGILSILTLKMLFGRLKVCDNVMWMVVCHVEEEAELVPRFPLTVKGGFLLDSGC